MHSFAHIIFLLLQKLLCSLFFVFFSKKSLHSKLKNGAIVISLFRYYIVTINHTSAKTANAKIMDIITVFTIARLYSGAR